MAEIRFDTPIQPIKAMRAFFTLMRDKEDTTQVTVFRDAIDTNWYESVYQRFRASEAGAKILAEKRSLYDRLNDAAFLASLPEGILGREYYGYMQAEGLTPEGFRSAYRGAGRALEELGEERALVHYRLLDMHDLLHIVTGYGRDGFGEVCILQFQGSQFRTFGLRLLSWVAAVEVKRAVPDAPAFKCVAEARRIALAAADMATADWEGYLTWPVADVRRALNISLPETYLARYDEWQQIDRAIREDLARERAEKSLAQKSLAH
ncbi:MAG TPA: Coq4 family protein [Parvularculaceae bacterium]|nr:Coq4 family protein [Parvularculaceae bacterium]